MTTKTIAILTLAAGSPAFAQQFPINLSAYMNAGSPYAPLSPTGAFMGPEGVEFLLSTDHNRYCWSGDTAANGGAQPVSLDIPVNAPGVQTFFTLINTSWGQSGPASYIRLEFFGSGTAYQRFDLVGNRTVRDWRNTVWTNQLDANGTTRNAWSANHPSQGAVRIDMQRFDLDPAFLAETLTSVRITDTGRRDFQRALLMGATAVSASAEYFYSVDLGSDELVRINSLTGEVVPIGPLGFDATNVQLARLNGVLYAVQYHFPGTLNELYVVDEGNGGATLLGVLRAGGAAVTACEGLTVRNGALVVAYNTNPGEASWSHFLGNLSLTGEVTPLGDFSVDMDEIAADRAGRLFAVDWNGQASETWRIDPNARLGPAASVALVGLAFGTLDLYGLTQAVEVSLLRISGSTGGSLSSTSLSRAGTYSGLALAPEPPCYPDCDTGTGVGVLDIFDFLCFQNRFAAMEPYACDCDTQTGLGVCDIFDFLCFQNAYAAGCP